MIRLTFEHVCQKCIERNEHLSIGNLTDKEMLETIDKFIHRDLTVAFSNAVLMVEPSRAPHT